jgi:hypothetical protein
MPVIPVTHPPAWMVVRVDGVIERGGAEAQAVTVAVKLDEDGGRAAACSRIAGAVAVDQVGVADCGVVTDAATVGRSDWWLPTFTQVPQAICHLTVPGYARAVMILARPGRSVHGLCDQRKQTVRNRVEPDMGTASRLTR